MTTCLPFEILTGIFEQVNDVTDLRNLRTVSRTLCAASSPLAFRVLTVTSTREGAKILDGCLMSRKLRHMSGRSLIATQM